jgi:hypothetical protein
MPVSDYYIPEYPDLLLSLAGLLPLGGEFAAERVLLGKRGGDTRPGCLSGVACPGDSLEA